MNPGRADAARIGTVLARIAMLVVGPLAIISVLLWIFQERVVFLPPAVPGIQGRNATRVEYRAEDGQRLFGFLVKAASGDSARGAIVVFHGNGDLADSWTDWARVATQVTGLPILLAEYRGYGGLSGRPSYAGATRDARAAIDFVRACGPPLSWIMAALSIGVARPTGAGCRARLTDLLRRAQCLADGEGF